MTIRANSLTRECLILYKPQCFSPLAKLAADNVSYLLTTILAHNFFKLGWNSSWAALIICLSEAVSLLRSLRQCEVSWKEYYFLVYITFQGRLTLSNELPSYNRCLLGNGSVAPWLHTSPFLKQTLRVIVIVKSWS